MEPVKEHATTSATTVGQGSSNPQKTSRAKSRKSFGIILKWGVKDAGNGCRASPEVTAWWLLIPLNFSSVMFQNRATSFGFRKSPQRKTCKSLVVRGVPDYCSGQPKMGVNSGYWQCLLCCIKQHLPLKPFSLLSFLFPHITYNFLRSCYIFIYLFW